MTPPGSIDRYTRTAALLHWLMALLIIANIAIGLTDGKLASMAVHKSIGLSVLALAIVRICWRLGHRPPALPTTIRPVTRRAAMTMHLALYGLMILVPLSGWLFVSNAPTLRPLSWFEAFAVPYLTVGPWIYAPAKTVHAALAWGFALLAAGHILAALWHARVERPSLLRRLDLGRPHSPA